MGAYKDALPDGKNPSRSPSGMLIPGGRHGYRLETRRQEAQERAEVRAQRSPQEQLAVLDKRLGKGQGAARERARLQKLIDSESSDA